MKYTHYVYKITNHKPSDSRKYYIGVRTAKGCSPYEDTNYWSSSKYISEAIKETGIESFSKEILSIWENREDAIKEEIRLHQEFDVANNNEYFNKAKQTSSKFNYDATGKIVSNETRKKLSIAAKNRPAMSDEQKEKIRQHNLGKKLSDETKKKMSLLVTGRKHTTESIEKMKSAQSNRSKQHQKNMKLSGLKKRGENNHNAQKINIYNSEHKLMFETFGTFKKVCLENNLPFRSLRDSRQHQNHQTHEHPA